MDIIYKPIFELHAYENNPRINDDAVEPVAKSIKEFGFKVPILIDKDNVIIAGHTRLKAAQALGMKEVPCILCDDLTPEQVKAFRLADNKVAEFADWDIPLLELEVKEVELVIKEAGLEDLVNNLPPIDIDGYLERMDNKQDEEPKPKQARCPHCGEWVDIDEI
jgi:ParB-like chromosome segregation protein Spo0J